MKGLFPVVSERGTALVAWETLLMMLHDHYTEDLYKLLCKKFKVTYDNITQNFKCFYQNIFV